jgi:glycosyltransferase involved in cell wall biosynthesis
MSAKLRLALVLNVIAPARLALYSGLARHFDLHIIHGAHESNRSSWKSMEEQVPEAVATTAWGWQFRMARRAEGQVIDSQHIHIRPGILRELLQFRPNAVISNEMGFRSVVSLLYGMIFRIPVWIWWGGTLHTERHIGIARKALRFFISRSVSHWISYGASSTEYLISLKVPQSRIVEIQNPVDERQFADAPAAAEFDLQPRPVLLCIGQLIARKGIALFLQAAARLQAEGEVFSILLVGDGPDKVALEQKVTDLGLRHVSFHKSRRPGELPAVYRSADALIFPTLEDVWGLVANEAILSGLPVLCSQYAGCARELFPPQNIFDPEDEDEFVRKLRNAVHGQLAPADPSRLVSNAANLEKLVRAIQSTLPSTQFVYSGKDSYQNNS